MALEPLGQPPRMKKMMLITHRKLIFLKSLTENLPLLLLQLPNNLLYLLLSLPLPSLLIRSSLNMTDPDLPMLPCLILSVLRLSDKLLYLLVTIQLLSNHNFLGVELSHILSELIPASKILI
jgi:hypothetical protein